MLLICSFASAGAQNYVPDSIVSPQIKKAARNTSDYYIYLADSFSHHKDSVNASKYFAMIDPYYLLHEDCTPNNLDSFFSRYTLTGVTKKSYRERYKKLYDLPRTRVYDTFKAMATEDQQLRNLFNKCGDSFTCARINHKMQYSDSLHAVYLYNYVKEHGWPSLEDGSLYACLLAIHDHPHHNYYLPIMEKAVPEDKVPIQAYYLVSYWSKNNWSWHEIEKILKTDKKAKFDISSVLNNKLPPQDKLNAITNCVHKHCPFRNLFILVECKDINTYWNWFYQSNAKGNSNKDGHILNQLMKEIRTGCTAKLPNDLWMTYWMPTTNNKVSVTLYVVY